MRTRHASYDDEQAAPTLSDNERKEEEEEEEEEAAGDAINDADSGSSSSSSSDGSDDDDSSSEEDSFHNEEQEEGEGEKDAVSQAEIRHAVALASEAAAKTFGWDQTKMGGSGRRKTDNVNNSTKRQGVGEGNVLSDLIPGYTAPMRLETTYAKSDWPKSLDELRKRAMETDQSTAGSVLHSTAQQRRAESMQRRSWGDGRGGGGATSFKLGTTGGMDGTVGSGWFGMVPAALTDEVKTDVAVIRNRTYLDPKRFYKKSDAIDPRFIQVGTVIEGADEYYSSRLTKKQRRQNITEEIMADADVRAYTKKQYSRVQTSRQGRFDQGYGRKKQRGGRGGRGGGGRRGGKGRR